MIINSIIWLFALPSEWNTGHIKVLEPPKDAVVHYGSSGVQMDCTVEGMTHRDSLTWWRYTKQGGIQKLYVSNPGLLSSQASSDVYLDSDKYEIRGHYNLYVKNISTGDAGRYMCEVTGLRNYTAELVVVGESNERSDRHK